MFETRRRSATLAFLLFAAACSGSVEREGEDVEGADVPDAADRDLQASDADTGGGHADGPGDDGGGDVPSDLAQDPPQDGGDGGDDPDLAADDADSSADADTGTADALGETGGDGGGDGSGGDDPDVGPPPEPVLLTPSSAEAISCGSTCCNGEIPFPTAGCTNVARGASVTVSGTYFGGFEGQFIAPNAVDGETICTAWNAGAYAPQWIVIDFGVERSISGLTLVAESVPATVAGRHVFEVSDDGIDFEAVAYIEQEMTIAWHYQLPFSDAVDARFLRITTTASPSWVAWREIAAFECR